MGSEWERFDESFDSSDGGPLYISDNGDDTYDVAGVLWLDTVSGDGHLPYSALIARFDKGDDLYGLVVSDKFSAADAFNEITDGYVVHDLGEYETMDEAIGMIETTVAVEPLL